MLQQIGPLYAKVLQSEEHSGTVHELDIIVFWVDNNGLNSPDVLREESLGVNISFYQKPINATEVKQIFQETSMSRLNSNTKTSATVVETTDPQ